MSRYHTVWPARSAGRLGKKLGALARPGRARTAAAVALAGLGAVPLMGLAGEGTASAATTASVSTPWDNCAGLAARLSPCELPLPAGLTSAYLAFFNQTSGLPYFSVGMGNDTVQIAMTNRWLTGPGGAAGAAPRGLPGLGGLLGTSGPSS